MKLRKQFLVMRVIKCLGINLTEDLQDLYTAICKILLQKIKDQKVKTTEISIN